MATVGGVTVDILRGETSDLKERVDTWTVPGINGIGAHSLGTNESGFAYTCMRFTGSAAGEAFLRAIDGLQGSVVTIVDDFGLSRTNMLIKSVTGHRKNRITFEGVTDSVVAQVTITGEVTA